MGLSIAFGSQELKIHIEDLVNKLKKIKNNNLNKIPKNSNKSLNQLILKANKAPFLAICQPLNHEINKKLIIPIISHLNINKYQLLKSTIITINNKNNK